MLRLSAPPEICQIALALLKYILYTSLATRHHIKTEHENIMTLRDYILSQAGLPFDLGSFDPEADKLYAAIPGKLNAAWSRARSHQDTVLAGDDISDWMRDNWRSILPDLSARFPA
jgi:hypothetical protein